MLRVLLTSTAYRQLYAILQRERRENPRAVFRIRETRRGIYDNAAYELRIGLDEQEENDETADCNGLPFVADRDFLDMRGRTHIFYIVTDRHGMPSVSQSASYEQY